MPGGKRASRVLGNRLAIGAVSLAIADVAGKAAGFLITPYLANRMGAAEFGVLNLYLSVTQILTFAISLGGAGLLGADYIRNGYTSARRLRSANLRVSLWVSVALLGVSLLVSFIVPAAVPFVSGALIVAVSYVQALNVLELSYYRGAQSYPFAVAGQFAFTVLNVLLTILLFEVESPSAINRLLCIALAGAAIQTMYLLELRRKRYEPADREIRRSNVLLVIRFGISLFVHQASYWIRSSVDRFVVSAYFGLTAAGVYSVAITLAIVQSTLFATVSQQLQPYMYRRLKERDFSGFRRLQVWFVAAVLTVTFLYYGFLLIFFEILFDSEYDSAMSLIPAMLAGAAAQSIYYVFTHAAFYERRGGEISSVSTIALIVHLLGLGGLALTGQVTPFDISLVFLVSSVVAMLGMAYLSRRTLNQLRRAVPEQQPQI